MTFKTGRTITTEEVLKPSTVYTMASKEKILELLNRTGAQIIEFRVPTGRDKGTVISDDRAPILRDGVSNGFETGPRFIVSLPEQKEFPEWE